MKIRQSVILFSSLLATIMIAAPALAKNDLPAVNEEGMELIKNTRLTSIYADPDANLSLYKKIILKDANVSFKKNWQREQNRNSSYAGAFWVKDSDVERIKKDTSALLNEVFTKELENRGYTLVDAAGDDVLVVQPEIVDLDVISPDLRNASRGLSYSDSAGEMTLELNLYDSQTNDLLVTSKDRKIDYKSGYYEWQNRVTNRAAALRVMQDWAKKLADTLDQENLTVAAR